MDMSLQYKGEILALKKMESLLQPKAVVRLFIYTV